MAPGANGGSGGPEAGPSMAPWGGRDNHGEGPPGSRNRRSEPKWGDGATGAAASFGEGVDVPRRAGDEPGAAGPSGAGVRLGGRAVRRRDGLGAVGGGRPRGVRLRPAGPGAVEARRGRARAAP